MSLNPVYELGEYRDVGGLSLQRPLMGYDIMTQLRKVRYISSPPSQWFSFPLKNNKKWVFFLAIAEFWTRVRRFLRPSPDVVHYILTHFHWLWDIINNTFLRNVLMRLVLTGQMIVETNSLGSRRHSVYLCELSSFYQQRGPA